MKSYVRHWLLIFALIVQAISPGFALAHQVVPVLAEKAAAVAHSSPSSMGMMDCHTAKQAPPAVLQKSKKHPCDCCDEHCKMTRCASVAWLVPLQFSLYLQPRQKVLPTSRSALVISRILAPPTPPPNAFQS
jgi:hypothetical protein